MCYKYLLFLFAVLNGSPLLSYGLTSRTKWISVPTQADKVNSWTAFRRDVQLDIQPASAITIIAADTKYWLWINGQLVVFEGGLKRGPNPKDTYYDRVELKPYLKKGNNHIAILLWHFGKDGFSHVNSGKAGLFFQLGENKILLKSDRSWLCRVHPAYGTADGPPPNYRLPESNIRFDARKDIDGWQTAELSVLPGFAPAEEIGEEGDAPWNRLMKRPIPQWKDFGVREAAFFLVPGKERDTVIAPLPYNMQMTPVIDVDDDSGGSVISIQTDHSVAGGTNNIRAEYITRKGIQRYESFGWMNGEKIWLIVPKNVKVSRVAYRETGYDTEPLGTFSCSDSFYNRYWEKAKRTLYVNMRDNFFDCPDRERAQWWGDVVLLMGECFYTYSVSTHALMRKAIDELCNWQRTAGELFSPIPGSFDQELPDQMLTSIGTYGFWNYYLNTGDREQVKKMYPAVKRYLSLWKTDETGLTILREGGWLWGDWGDNKDLRLIMAGWHYTALEGAVHMARLLGRNAEARQYRNIMEEIKTGYNRCWNGKAYRHPAYVGKTDDRVQALAVITGIADSSRYKAIFNILTSEFHASPYMEKYVMEALFKMDEGAAALSRARERFSEMVDNPGHTTLFEGWGIGERGFGGGTTNHAWSGGGQIVISANLFGIRPLKAGYKTFLVQPQPASFVSGTLTIPTIKGMIGSSFQNDHSGFTLNLTVPRGSKAVVRLPAGSSLLLNHKLVHRKKERAGYEKATGLITLTLRAGNYRIERKMPI